MIRFFTVLVLINTFYLRVYAQIELEYIQPEVIYNDQSLIYAFAGGINSAQYQTIDLDEDKDLDLVLFDRSSNKINCFENTGSSYIYEPSFEYLFPEDLEFWMILEDYNCDGRKDLFTYTNLGIRVFENQLSNGQIQWKLVAEPLKTQGSSSLINLLFNPTDFPSIKDLDNDGDLDILVFDFASSSQIEFHRNTSFENSGNCGLEFTRETRTYGDIFDCGCDDFKVNEPCGSARILHAGGKALLSMDYNGDGLMDLILSQEGCNNLNYAENNGSFSAAGFNPFQNNFPDFTNNLGFASFPMVSHEDVTFDGKKDLIISSNERSNSLQNIDFKQSSILYANEGLENSNTFHTPVPFLQDEMIDVGEYAYPAIVDINGDGFEDLVIGNAGSLKGDEYISSLSVYLAGSNNLIWSSEDFLGMSALNFTEIKPQFIDLNTDGHLDFVFSAVDGSLNAKLGYIINQGGNIENMKIAEVQYFDSDLSRLDDFVFSDINNDQLPDLLIGQSNGQLNSYLNTGSETNPSFTLDSESFLNLSSNGDKSNLSLSVGDLDNDGNVDLITTDRSGVMTFYSNFITNTTTPQEALIKIEPNNSLETSHLGRITKPAIGKLLGRNVVAVGSIQGGIRLLASSSVSSGNELQLSAYPIPTQNDRTVSFQSNLSNTLLEIYSLSGHKITEVTLSANTSFSVNLNSLEPGLYLARATNGNQSCTKKIVLGKPFN